MTALIIQRRWAAASFESTIMNLDTSDITPPTIVPSLSTKFIVHSSHAAIARAGRFLMHLLSTERGTLRDGVRMRVLLCLLQRCLAEVESGDFAVRLRVTVFESEVMRDLFLSQAGVAGGDGGERGLD